MSRRRTGVSGGAPAGSPGCAARASVAVCQECWAGDGREVVGRVPLCGLGDRTGVRTQAVECFDVCEGDSVTVVRPSPQGRRAGGRPGWLRETHDPDVLDAVASWLEAGGPGVADMPDLVALHSFTPPRRVRVVHEE